MRYRVVASIGKRRKNVAMGQELLFAQLAPCRLSPQSRREKRPQEFSRRERMPGRFAMRPTVLQFRRLISRRADSYEPRNNEHAT